MRALGAAAVGLGVLAALAAALLWTAGRDALDSDRFASDAVEALRTPEGSRAVSGRVAGRVGAAVPGGAAADPALRGAVGSALARPAAEAALRPALASAHAALLDLSGDAVELRLDGLRDPLASELSRVDPALAAQVPAGADLGTVTVARPPGVPGVDLTGVAGRVPELTALLAAAAAVLIALGVGLSPRPGRTAAGAGVALVILAAVPAALRVLAPEAAEAAVADPDEAAVAAGLAEGLMSSWAGATAALALAGAALLAGAAVARRR